jgi:hypothetical protein
MWYGPDLLDNPTAKDAVAEFKAKDVDPEALRDLPRRRAAGRAVDAEGEVLDVLVQSKRNKRPMAIGSG